jgi:hypothetical protein
MERAGAAERFQEWRSELARNWQDFGRNVLEHEPSMTSMRPVKFSHLPVCASRRASDCAPVSQPLSAVAGFLSARAEC